MAKSNKLVEQRQALDSFFESLMRDVEAFSEEADVAEETAQPAPPVAAAPVITPPPAAPKPVVRDVARLPVSEPPARPVLVKPAAASIYESLPPAAPPAAEVKPVLKAPKEEPPPRVEPPEPEAVPAAPTAARPQADPPWLGKELQAMLFKVAGLTLAVPLVDLHGVVEWDEDKVTAMPGHADFYLGLLSHLKRNIPIVDTARLVLPEDKLALLADEDPCQRIGRVVLINDSRYGLGCDEVNEVITLKADDVRWRSQRTRRRWLAGTVIKHMCALIDANAFAELLAERAPVTAFRE